MENTAFKTFVYSFVFSLFMIFGINGLFFDTRPAEQNLKISNKNITLFLKNDTIPSTKPLPVKKIALSVLPDISQNEGIITADYYEIPDDNQIIMADNSDIIPLEFSETAPDIIERSDEEPTAPVLLAANEQTEPDVPALYAPVRAQVISISDGPEPEQKQELDVPADITGTTKPEPVKLAAVYTPQKLPEPTKDLSESLKKEKNSVSQKVSEQPQLLIPLERSDTKAFAAGKKIKISNGAEENQVALADAKVSTKNISATREQLQQPSDGIKEDNSTQPVKWESMAEKNGQSDSPWVVASGAKYAKNKMFRDEQKDKNDKKAIKLESVQKAGGKETVAANDMVDNLLIPIPQEIKEKGDLKPRLQFPEDAEVETKAEEAEAKQKSEVKILDAQGKNIAKPQKQSSGGNLLSSITSIFSGSSDDEDDDTSSGSLTERIKNKLSGKKTTGKILPAEIRLSFQPNRAEISGNTLRWIDAFAQKAIEDKSVVLEIRLDGTTDQHLQRRRLNLLSNVLNSKGVDARDVQVVFTEREPNSFIIRTLRTSEDSGYDTMENYNNPEAGVTQW